MPQARLTDETYSVVIRIANETGQSQQEVLERAVKLYEREQFFAEFEADFERLRSDSNAWAEMEAEREDWDAVLVDGSAE
ncbi:MAG: toxin-antitoxin system protein [Gemmatimonadota bacterium]